MQITHLGMNPQASRYPGAMAGEGQNGWSELKAAERNYTGLQKHESSLLQDNEERERWGRRAHMQMQFLGKGALGQPLNQQQQISKSNVYILSFASRLHLDFRLPAKLDLLNKGDLKQQLIKLQKAEEGLQTWKMVAIAFGNLSKNTLFNDLSRSTQTNLIFWRKKIGIWKSHPLGLGVILKLLHEYQESNNFV